MENGTDIFKWIFGALSGGVGVKLIDHFINLKQKKLANERTFVETDGLVSDKWERFCAKMENQIERQRVELEKLILENIELKEQLIRLRTYSNFKDAEA